MTATQHSRPIPVPEPLSELHDLNGAQLSLPISAFMQSIQFLTSPGQLNLGIVTPADQCHLQRIAEALADHHVPSSQDNHAWNSLASYIMQLRDKYQIQMDLMRIRPMESDQKRAMLLEEIQRQSQQLDQYGQAHQELTELLGALQKLSKEWKRARIETIITSLVSSTPLQGCRVVKVTRQHLTSLGLGLGSLNKLYLVFEESTATELECHKLINDIARDFGDVFEENVAQNLARMAGNYQHVFNVDEGRIHQDMQHLANRIFSARPQSILWERSPRGLEAGGTGTGRRASGERVHGGGGGAGGGGRCSIGSQTPGASDTSIFSMAQPVFEPAVWDWPVLLKRKMPRYRPLWWWRKKQNEATEKGIWTVSLVRLANHFTHVGQNYYANMLNNARLMHGHQARVFELAMHSLTRCYKALQIEQGHAYLIQSLVYLYQIQQDAQRTALQPAGSAKNNKPSSDQPSISSQI
ncbi:uncharacterized protein BYT42DRAFT_567390 [Radiomyces spectabilis]|uniref:uncharacterized protein n=1 Tax=Radiomyces spectabilis TaxID=64574 RepID=UPI00221E4A70|nr:uncharacterized protein BYT42DRAFT_567390 [Radiomyces spectabilis]KAI8379083.1 hypothetical protein BYT42DRAFT_567390 [Radiomyces spectabilis]